jgi:hypothetical protein
MPMTRAVTIVAAALATAASGAGCGEDKAQRTTTQSSARGPIPAPLRTVESASEDAIDLALAGKRRQVVEKARTLKAAADGPAADVLRKAGVNEATIADFRARADRVARLAPRADLLRVALASNHAFGAVPGFFALYENRVPADVTRLDYLDFEAKLRATAGDHAQLRAAIAQLAQTWRKLRPAFVTAGGYRVAPKFDEHVTRIQRLAAGTDRAATVREAQHGLDLVDQLEDVYGH